MSMSWGEFKRRVEAQGVTEEDELWYIDVSHPAADDPLVVVKDAIGVAVSTEGV